MSAPHLAPFNAEQPIGLHKAPNGGWVVYARAAERGCADQVIGAFSDAKGMIDALAAALVFPPVLPSAKCQKCQDHGFADWALLSVVPCPVCRPGDDGVVP